MNTIANVPSLFEDSSFDHTDYNDPHTFDGQVDVRPPQPDSGTIFGVLALFALRFPFSVPSKNDAVIGINYKTVYDDPRGALIKILFYTNRTPEDVITIWFTGIDAVHTIEVPKDINDDDDVETYIPAIYFKQAAQFSSDGNIEIWYFVKRKSDNTSEKSTVLTARIKVDLPGGKDPDPDTPHHQALLAPKLPEQLEKEGAVTESWIKAGVTVSVPHYLFMTLGDVIQILWGTATVSYTVRALIQPGEFIEILIPGEKILESGETYLAKIRYWITDELQNDSSDFSEFKEFPVRAGETRLRAPLVKGVDSQDRLFLDKIAPNPGIIQVLALDSPFIPGDAVIVTLSVSTQDGDRVLFVKEQIVSGPSIMEFEVPYETLREIPPGPVKVRYDLKKPDQTLIPSNHYLFILVAKAILLTKPLVIEAKRGYVSHLLPRAIVEVAPYLDMRVNQKITIYWFVTRFNGQTHLYETYRPVTKGLVNRPVPFNISGPEHINRFNTSKLEVWFKVTEPDGMTERHSYRERLYIGDVQPYYPPPSFHPSYGPVLEDGILSIEKISVFIDAFIEALKDLKLRETLFFRWENENGEPIFEEVLEIVPANINHDFLFLLEEQLFKEQLDRYAHIFYWIEDPDGWPRASQALVFRIGEIIPKIESLKDSKGEILEGTFDNRVDLKGSARPNRSVNVYDRGVLKAPITADGDGICTYVMENLSAGLHSIVLEGDYGNNPRSDARDFNVLVAQMPQITSIKTPQGNAVPHNQSTIARTLTLSGSANANQQVEVWQGNVSKGPVPVDASENWSLVVSNLTYALHHFTAKALYGTGLTSPTRTVRVVEALTPVITSIVDIRDRPIGRGTGTYSRTVKMTGTATANQQVHILLNSVVKQTIAVGANGIWSTSLPGLTVGTYSIVVRPAYGGQDSASWGFSVLQWLTDDVTTFDHWNGWVAGPAAARGDLTLRYEQGNWRLNNYTYSQNSAGVVMQKTFHNLEVNGLYRFYVALVRYDGRYAYPILSLMVDGVAITSPIHITSKTWTTLWGDFHATASQMTLQIYSHLSTGNGNDWEGDNFRLVHL